MGTVTRYPQRVARPKYTPPSVEVAARIDDLVERYRRWQAAGAEYRESLALVGPAGDVVPIAYLAGRLKVTRKTVYRHLGRPMK